MLVPIRDFCNRCRREVDPSDIPETLDWSDAVQGKFFRPLKQPVSIRIDADVLAWFKAQEGRYQTRINDALREYMRQHYDAK